MLDWICVVWYPGGRGSNGVAGAGTGGITNGTFQTRLIFGKAAEKQRERLTSSECATEAELRELSRLYSMVNVGFVMQRSRMKNPTSPYNSLLCGGEAGT